MSQPILSGPSLRARSGQCDSLVIILHGYGADGANLIDLGGEWQSILPNTEFVAPNAPFACEAFGAGYQWFSLKDWTPEKLRTGAASVAPTLHQYIDTCLQERNLTPDRLVLVGFSQGAMIALLVGLELQEACAGIVGYSGASVAPVPLEPKTKPPVLLIHGEQDPVVPVDALHHAEKNLKNAGINVQTRIMPYLGHSIDHEGLMLGSAFIKNCLEASHWRGL
jgi:phospholipase/carboxylesterase